MKELLIRTVTGAIYVIVLLGAPLAGPWYFFGTYLLLTLLTLTEFYRLSKMEGASPFLSTILLLGIWLFVHQFLKFETNLSLELGSGFLILILLVFVAELLRKERTPFLNLGMTAMGALYIGIPMGLLPFILYYNADVGFSPNLLFFILIVIWVHDTGAYLVGMAIGKHPLVKAISPKKTIEGLVGGIVLAGLAIYVFSMISTPLALKELLILGGVIIVFANVGDLFQSKWKRHLGIKDSGKSLPGHGGWLDRLDSFLMALPAVYVTLILLS